MNSKNPLSETASELIKWLAQRGDLVSDGNQPCPNEADPNSPDCTNNHHDNDGPEPADALDQDAITAQLCLIQLLERLRSSVVATAPAVVSNEKFLLSPGLLLNDEELIAKLQIDLGMSKDRLYQLLKELGRPLNLTNRSKHHTDGSWLMELAYALRPGGRLFVERFASRRKDPKVVDMLVQQAALRGWPQAVIAIMERINEIAPEPESDEIVLQAMAEWAARLQKINPSSKDSDGSDLPSTLIDAICLMLKRLPSVPSEILEWLDHLCRLTGHDPAVRLWRLKGAQESGQLMHVFLSRPIPKGRERDEDEMHKYYGVLQRPMKLSSVPDLSAARAELDRAAPHAREITEFLIQRVAAQANSACGAIKLPNILIEGPAGCGKDYYLVLLAKVLGLPYHSHNLGGGSDNRELEGTARGWGTSYPSVITCSIADSGVANPLIGFSEIEKYQAGGHNGNSHHTLLQILEPLTARHWRDVALGVDLDLRPLNFVATANSLQGIPKPLLSRFTVVHMRNPHGSEYFEVTQSLLRDKATRRGLEYIVFDDFEWEVMERMFRLKPSIRIVGRIVDRLLDERAQGINRPRH
jgi:hypothetical protein